MDVQHLRVGWIAEQPHKDTYVPTIKIVFKWPT